MFKPVACRRALWSLALSLSSAQADPQWIGRFDVAEPAIPAPWEIRSLNRGVPPTQYQLRLWEGVPSVEAVASRSMAMLARSVSINLSETPVLCWSWRVDASLPGADLRRKSGDDFAARMYVAFRVPPSTMSRMTRLKLALARKMVDSAAPDAAISYIWDNREPVGSELPSTYTDRVQMVVLRSGDADSGSWRTERRNVLEDFIRLFGAGPPTLDFVAFGSDTDNTGGEAHAGFADLHFVEFTQPCAPLSGAAGNMRP